MSSKEILLNMHPPSLTSGKIKVELEPLPAAILKCLVEQKSKKAISKEELALSLQTLGLSLPDFIKMQEVLKSLRKAMQVMGVDNPVLKVGEGLMLNRGIKITLETEDEPDILDAIYNDLMSN